MNLALEKCIYIVKKKAPEFNDIWDLFCEILQTGDTVEAWKL
jgi:hypothetical protein